MDAAILKWKCVEFAAVELECGVDIRKRGNAVLDVRSSANKGCILRIPSPHSCCTADIYNLFSLYCECPHRIPGKLRLSSTHFGFRIAASVEKFSIFSTANSRFKGF